VKISATIITFNEEHNIAEAIKSVAWADEVVVVDSLSTDATCRIAEELGARVIRREWPGFAEQKHFAAASATNDWIFSLDADERATSELAAEIVARRDSGQIADFDGYTVPRLSIYMGRPIRHGGWYPDRQLRLFNRVKGRWHPRIIHESVRMHDDARVAALRGNILHFSVSGPGEHALMIAQRYAPLSARQMLAEGRRTNTIKVIASGLGGFFRSYLLKAGFLDGFPGLCIAAFAGYNAFLKHLILYELQREPSAHGSPAATTKSITRAS